jgi:hypothetical protein
MRFANINFLFLIVLTCFTGELLLPKASLSAVWQILGREALTLELPDAQAAISINKFNQKLANIVPRLNPNQDWTIGIRTTKVRKFRSLQVKSALITLEGYNLIFITEADAISQGFSSVPDLADTWARSLANIFRDPALRKLLVIGIGMPAQINYRGLTYYLQPNIASDRGLFRTSGDRFMSKVIYWEVPPDSKAYQITSTSKALEPKLPPAEIFLLNRRQQFLSYIKERS